MEDAFKIGLGFVAGAALVALARLQTTTPPISIRRVDTSRLEDDLTKVIAALSEAVVRYEAMGWFNSESFDERQEATEAAEALARASALLKRIKGVE